MHTKDHRTPDSEETTLARPALPRRFGRYELALRLGSGGFASVYLGRTVGPGGFERFVAVKCIHPHHADNPGFVDMFLDEARIAASVHHPNVCSVFDFGEVDGSYYLAMEYLVGEPLSRIARRLNALKTRLSPVDRYRFIAQLAAGAADGLHGAHGATGPNGEPLDIVHRDVAPPNLFAGYDGLVQVVDFGCAKAAGSLYQTASGMARGHVAYLAPEQLTSRSHDRRVDIWALGVILWELLADRRLFQRASMHETMFAVARDRPPPVRDVAPAVPRELAAVVERALMPDPEDRFPTARAMSDALRAYLARGSGPSGPTLVARAMEQLFPAGRRAAVKRLERARGLLVTAEASRTEADRASPPRDGAAGTPAPRTTDPTMRLATVDARADSEAPGQHARRMARFGPAALASVALLATALGLVIGYLAGPGASPPDTALPSMQAPPLASSLGPSPLEPAAMACDPTPPTDTVADEEDTRAQAPTRVNVVALGGWADVYHGGSFLTRTPGNFELPPGKYRLKVLPMGQGEPRYIPVRVRPGEVGRLVIHLDEPTESLTDEVLQIAGVSEDPGPKPSPLDDGPRAHARLR